MKDQLLQALKLALKAKGLSYKKLAELLSLSEPSVKRIFSTGSLSLKRFFEICEVAEISPESLFDLISSHRSKEFEYSLEQESFLSKHPQLLAFFDLLLKNETPKSIARRHELSTGQMQRFLKDLDKLELIEWLPKDRVKVKTGPNVRWRKDGPLRKSLYPLAQEEFLRGPFETNDSENKFLIVDLSEKSMKRLKTRMQELIDEVTRESNIDIVSKSAKDTVGIFLAYRPWNFSKLKSPKTQSV